MNGEPSKLIRRHGRAWVLLCLTLALHVADEALTDFLSFYNPLVSSLRARYGWFPMPTFTFGPWLTGLILAVIGLLILSRWVYRGTRWLVPASYIFGVVMLLNGLGHMLGSVYFGSLLPGTYSSPLLLAASVYLLYAASARSK